MEEYIRLLLAQIRCSRIKGEIEKEIRGHILEQAAENEAAGMSRQEAIDFAVEDMGDPVEAGVALDRVHRPRPARKMILLMALISVVSILIQSSIGFYYEQNGMDAFSYISKNVFCTLLGFGVMLAVYYFDYSFLAVHARYTAAALLLFILLGLTLFGARINGAVRWIQFGGGPIITASYVLLLYVPVYGALLYFYRGKKGAGLAKSMLWMLPALFLAFRMSALNTAVTLLFLMCMLLTIALWNGWFAPFGKKSAVLLWVLLILAPAVFLLISVKLGWITESSYRFMRLKALLSPGNYTDSYNYLRNLLQNILLQSRLIGGNGMDTPALLADCNSSFLLAFLSSWYGIAAAAAVCAILLFLSGCCLRIVIRQKNRLGMIVGSGCCLIFFVSILQNIGINTGLLPTADTLLPFLSSGGTGTVVCYTLAGLVLSIYRHQNVLPSEPVTSVLNH